MHLRVNAIPQSKFELFNFKYEQRHNDRTLDSRSQVSTTTKSTRQFIFTLANSPQTINN